MRSKSEAIMNEIIDYIDECFFESSYIPTIQEIASVVGLDKSNVSRYLQDMKSKGMIDIGNGNRSVRTSKISKTLENIRRIPVVGSIACGTPMLAEENIESYLTISGSFLGSGKFFALRAKGDSMINANIDDGDFVIVREQNTAEEGQIVVALINDSATLKRLYRDDSRKMIRLHPENDNMDDMFFNKVDIQGIVKKVVKDVQ